jgi:hypothetical protein
LFIFLHKITRWLSGKDKKNSLLEVWCVSNELLNKSHKLFPTRCLLEIFFKRFHWFYVLPIILSSLKRCNTSVACSAQGTHINLLSAFYTFWWYILVVGDSKHVQNFIKYIDKGIRNLIYYIEIKKFTQDTDAINALYGFFHRYVQSFFFVPGLLASNNKSILLFRYVKTG